MKVIKFFVIFSAQCFLELRYDCTGVVGSYDTLILSSRYIFPSPNLTPRNDTMTRSDCTLGEPPGRVENALARGKQTLLLSIVV